LKVSPRNVAMLLVGLLVSIGLLFGVWMHMHKNNAPRFTPATVRGQGFTYDLLYYNDATVQTSRKENYLVSQDKQGLKTSIWITKINKLLPCGTSPSFSYTSATRLDSRASCYKSDRKVFVSVVIHNGQLYQINMTSDRPISVDDAKYIFGSVKIIP
ncbi:MAG TPA: hypothetical protein VLA92_04385, partial [Candidatus Saccharimonadales bacterium]|nr:hypothetical protein [Candidatus Saccharimonadales bacterium]